MEIRELEWFSVLARTENVTSAARLLHVSQPTLSRALAKIERSLGARLFDRQQNRLSLNKYGEIFQVHAMRAMNELDRGAERIRTLSDPERGVIAIGFLHSFGEWLVPELIEQFRKSSPGTSFELEGGAMDTIVDGVRKERFDIGFVAPQPVADDVAWIPLGRERLCLQVPGGDPFEGRSKVALTEIARRPMLALGPHYGIRQVVDRLFADAGLVPQITLEATELSTLRGLVKHGAGIAIVPAPADANHLPATLIPIDDANAFRYYGAVTRRYGPIGMAARAFLESVSRRSVGHE